MTSTKSLPKDLQAMSNLLKDFGITDYESSVENHMLEFTNRYVTTIIEDASLYSSHAKKKSIDIEDVKLAISLQQDKNFACPPSREITASLARQRNSLPLPTIRSSTGLRLPPDRHSLTACNFHLKGPTKRQRTVHAFARVNASSNMVPRPSFNVPKQVQSPIIKFSEGNKGSTAASTLSPMPAITPEQTTSSVSAQILMPTAGVTNTDAKLPTDVNSNKRPHEEDDDYDN